MSARVVSLREAHRRPCARCGATVEIEIATIVDCRGPEPAARVDGTPVAATCGRCGTRAAFDIAVLLLCDDGLVDAVFVPGEHTALDDDGTEAARLIAALDIQLGRPALRSQRGLTVAPRRLAAIVAARATAIDALAPDAVVAIEGVADPALDDYRAWLRAIGPDIGIADIEAGVRGVAQAPTWSAAADVCRATPLLTDPRAGPVVELAFDRLVGSVDESARVTAERCKAYVRAVREAARDPADVVIPGRVDGVPDASPAVQAALDAYGATPPLERDARIAHLRDARAGCVRAGIGERHVASVAVAAALATELHHRGDPGDVEDAFQILQAAIVDSEHAFGIQTLPHQRLVSDLAVMLLDRSAGDPREDRRRARELLAGVAATTIEGDEEAVAGFRAQTWMNLGVAWIEAVDVSDRVAAQEEAITWLEQALAAKLEPLGEAMTCSNLGAVYRIRVAGDGSENRARARALHERGVGIVRGLDVPDSGERLAMALAMYASAAAESGDLDDAVDAFREALDLARRSLPIGHPVVLRARANLGSTLHSRYLARRAFAPLDAAADLGEAQRLLESAYAELTAERSSQPFVLGVASNLAAVLAESLGPDGRVDGARAAVMFEELLERLDPDMDVVLRRAVGWNAGMFHLGEGSIVPAQHALRQGWEAARQLLDRSLLLAARSNELLVLSRHAHRLAIAACMAPDEVGVVAAAFDALDESRLHLLGGVAERARLAIDDPATIADAATREALVAARSALDRQILDESIVRDEPPPQRRARAAGTRATIEQAMALLAGHMPDVAGDARAEVPVVHIATCEIGTAVIIRLPDGEQIGFTADLRSEHLADLVAAEALSGGDYFDTRDALDDALPLVGTLVAEPLAAQLAGRGWRSAIVVAGGPMAIVPLGAAPLRSHGRARDGVLADVFALRATPAARMLRRSAHSTAHAPDRLLAVVDETLPAGRWEVAADVPVLRRARERGDVRPEVSRPEASQLMPSLDWLHLAAHGEQGEDPLHASIRLPGGELAVLDLLVANRLRGGCVVVAPACRSGRVHVSNLDEGVSVGHGLIAAGAETVIAGFWDLPDLATALIVARMYALLDEHALWARPDTALRSAQRWVRDATVELLDTEVREAFAEDQGTWMSHELAGELGSSLRRHRGSRPFAHPVDWAGLGAVSTRSGPD